MINNQNINPTSFISSKNEIKAIPLLIPKLKSSLKLQKEFIKEIEQKLKILADNEVQNKIELNSLVKDFMDEIPFIIKELGISFAHYFFLNSDIFYSLMGIYFDSMDKNDEKIEIKIKNIFEACINVFEFIFSNNDINKNKNYLKGIEIIKDNNTLIVRTPLDEEKIYENCYVLLNGLKELIKIGKDKEKINELEKKFIELKKEIKILSLKISNESKQATIEFFDELIQEINNNFENIYSSEQNENNSISIKEISENKIIKEEMNKPLDQRTSLYLDEEIKENQNEVIEFNNYPLPFAKNGDVEENLKRQICGFLNTKGGRLYIGINGEKKVTGIELNSKNRDISRNEIINLTYGFHPNCRTEKIYVDFIPVKNANTQEFISKRYVVKIRVYPGDPDALYSFTTKGYHSTIRRNNKCVELDSTEIYNEIIERDEIKKIKDQDNIIFKENNIRDPVPEINENEEEDDEYYELPFFGVDSNENLSDNIKKKVKENEPKKYKKPNMVREGSFTVKVTNIDENLSSNDVNRFFNGCKCYSQKMMKGHGYLNFSKLIDAKYCIDKYDGKKLGKKFIKLSLTNN